MRLNTLLCLAAGLACSLANAGFAQLGRPAAQLVPQVETVDIRPGGSAWLILRVTLPAGLHVQSDAPRDPALIPTLLSIDAPAGLTIAEIRYPAAEDFKQAGLAQPLAVFGHDFMIRIRVEIGPGVVPGNLPVRGRLRYQACDDRVCFPPVSAEVSWNMEVTADLHQSGTSAAGVAAQISAPGANQEAAPTPRTIVAMTRAAMAGDFGRAEQLVRSFQSNHGVTPEMLLAKSWLGRGALAAGNLDAAEAHAQQTYELGLAELRRRSMDDEANFPTAFGAAIEVLGRVAAERGRRSEAIAFLSQELGTYGQTSIHKRIQKNINVLSLEGTVAPPLDLSDFQGVTPPSLAELKGRVVLLFFWAHWCSDCKAQGPGLENLIRKYGAQGFTVVAPTQRYGYAAGGAPASLEAETRYIEDIRRDSYGWMAGLPVTLNETNHRRYGVSTTPTIVLVDRAGLVRLYHPGMMTEAQLEPLVKALLEEAAPVAVE